MAGLSAHGLSTDFMQSRLFAPHSRPRDGDAGSGFGRISAATGLGNPAIGKKAVEAGKFARALELLGAAAEFGAGTMGLRTRRFGLGGGRLELFCPVAGKFSRSPGFGAWAFAKLATKVAKKATTNRGQARSCKADGRKADPPSVMAEPLARPALCEP